MPTIPFTQRRRVTIGLGTTVLALIVAYAAIGVHRHIMRQRHLSAAHRPPPPGMVYVPAGDFIMGSDDANAEADERPQRTQFLEAFYIDKHEVTNQEYQRFNPEHRYPDGQDDFPVTGVHKLDAEAYCRSLHKRLPTNAEWEKAARGTDGRIYPWGDAYIADHANVRLIGDNERGKETVGSYTNGASPYGCMDMAGNVWEWVSDVHQLGDGPKRGVLRGGAHGYSPFQARSSYHGFEDLLLTCNDVGFRCAADAVPIDR